LLGFNNNVRHRGRIFHIQTEDSGTRTPRIVTHLFADGGRIIKTTRTDYSEHVDRSDMAAHVRGMMKEQHKAMFTSLRQGELDALLESVCGPFDVPAASAPRPPGTATTVPVALSEESAVESQAPAGPRRQRTLSNPNLRKVTPSVAPPPKEAFDILGSLEKLPPRAVRADTPDPSPVHKVSPPRKSNPAPGGRKSSPPRKSRGNSVPPQPTVPRPGALPNLARQSGPPSLSRPSSRFAAVPSKSAQSIFGDGVISEQSLDEVILSYLAEDLDGTE
jgi:hypothetical protein